MAKHFSPSASLFNVSSPSSTRLRSLPRNSTDATNRVASQRDSLELRVQSEESKIERFYMDSSTELRLLEAELKDVQRELELFGALRIGEKSVTIQSAMMGLENLIKRAHHQFSEERKLYDSKISQIVDAAMQASQTEFRANLNEHVIDWLEYAQDVGWNLEQLARDLNDVVEKRKMCLKTFESSFLLEFQKLRTMLSITKKEHEETNEAMISMIDGMKQQAIRDLSLSRKRRVATEEAILQILESTCNELEDGLFPMAAVDTSFTASTPDPSKNLRHGESNSCLSQGSINMFKTE